MSYTPHFTHGFFRVKCVDVCKLCSENIILMSAGQIMTRHSITLHLTFSRFCLTKSSACTTLIGYNTAHFFTLVIAHNITNKVLLKAWRFSLEIWYKCRIVIVFCTTKKNIFSRNAITFILWRYLIWFCFNLIIFFNISINRFSLFLSSFNIDCAITEI